MNCSTLQKEEPIQSEEVCSVPSFSMGVEQSWPEELSSCIELLFKNRNHPTLLHMAFDEDINCDQPYLCTEPASPP